MPYRSNDEAVGGPKPERGPFVAFLNWMRCGLCCDRSNSGWKDRNVEAELFDHHQRSTRATNEGQEKHGNLSLTNRALAQHDPAIVIRFAPCDEKSRQGREKFETNEDTGIAELENRSGWTM